MTYHAHDEHALAEAPTAAIGMSASSRFVTSPKTLWGAAVTLAGLVLAWAHVEASVASAHTALDAQAAQLGHVADDVRALREALVYHHVVDPLPLAPSAGRGAGTLQPTPP